MSSGAMITLDSDKPEVQRLKEQFKRLTAAPFEVQVKEFCTRYIFLLGEDGYAEVKDVANEFQRFCGFNELELSLNDPNTSRFLEDAGHEFVSQFQKAEIFRVLDIDGNKKIALIEYLLYRFKPDILTDYYKRIGQEHRIPEDEDELYARVDPDTGYALVSELLLYPAFGKDSLLDKMTRTVSEDQVNMEKEIEKLQKQLQSPSNVVRKRAAAELGVIAEQDREEVQNKKRLSIKRRGNIIRKEQEKLILMYDRKTAEKTDRRFQTVINQEAEALPPGWNEYFDDDSGQPYYYNTVTQVTQWERPSE